MSKLVLLALALAISAVSSAPPLGAKPRKLISLGDVTRPVQQAAADVVQGARDVAERAKQEVAEIRELPQGFQERTQAVRDVVDRINPFRRLFPRSIGDVTRPVQQAGENVVQGTRDAADWASQEAGEIREPPQGLQEVVGSLTSGSGPFRKLWPSVPSVSVGDITGAAEKARDQVVKPVQDAIDRVQDAGDQFADAAKDTAGAVQNIGERAVDVAQDMGQKVDALQDSFENAADNLQEVVQEPLEDLQETVQEPIANAVAPVKDAWDGARQTFDDAQEVYHDSVSRVRNVGEDLRDRFMDFTGLDNYIRECTNRAEVKAEVNERYEPRCSSDVGGFPCGEIFWGEEIGYGHYLQAADAVAKDVLGGGMGTFTVAWMVQQVQRQIKTISRKMGKSANGLIEYITDDFIEDLVKKPGQMMKRVSQDVKMDIVFEVKSYNFGQCVTMPGSDTERRIPQPNKHQPYLAFWIHQD
ncbi:unnamed protein product [Vitrella brassicaformis CCMP3155]|uniref:Uncharacterized protein n=3 Tax=Vitrella brassicaformis TaxID=1169539 RepID=A0A0G4FAP8_VITBC|nr:unnamed protein product [Vitrella brassicaformis CCMP3155]|eukprot:CEM09663.1 unnamed protein product [Vitrella brassicaformis CCMP3155]